MKTPTTIDRQVGRRLRSRRKELNMNVQKLGAMVGISFQQLVKYEQGLNRISAGRLQQLSQILGVPIEFFFGDAPRSASIPGMMSKEAAATSAFIAHFLAMPEGPPLARAFMHIDSSKLRRAIVHLVQEIADR